MNTNTKEFINSIVFIGIIILNRATISPKKSVYSYVLCTLGEIFFFFTVATFNQ